MLSPIFTRMSAVPVEQKLARWRGGVQVLRQ